MTQIEEVKKLFDRIKMLQKTFSLIREGRIKASDFPSRTSKLMEAIKEDVVTPAVNEVEKRCDINASNLQHYFSQLQELCTQTEYYIPTKVGMRVPLCPTVTDALIDACSLTSKEAAQDLFADYIFIIDQRNEIARRLESELARLQEEQEQLKTKQEQEADRLKQEKEQERKERQKEQAEMMKSIAEIKSIAEMMKKQKEEQKPKKAPKKASFMELVGTDDKEGVMKYLHNLIDGHSGIQVAATLCAAVDLGYLHGFPNQEQYESDFELIGTWGAIECYSRERKKQSKTFKLWYNKAYRD